MILRPIYLKGCEGRARWRPDVALRDFKFPPLERAEDKDYAQSEVVLIFMELCDGVAIELEGRPAERVVTASPDRTIDESRSSDLKRCAWFLV